MLRIGAAGLWSLLNARVQIPSTWTTDMGLTDSRSVATYTGSYHDIAAQIIANACASGSNAIGHAFNLIRYGMRDRVLAGGYDSISEMVFAGFDSLQASTPEKCRPFDKERTGLVLGEGAAVLALEAWDSARARGAARRGRRSPARPRRRCRSTAFHRNRARSP